MNVGSWESDLNTWQCFKEWLHSPAPAAAMYSAKNIIDLSGNKNKVFQFVDSHDLL